MSQNMNMSPAEQIKVMAWCVWVPSIEMVPIANCDTDGNEEHFWSFARLEIDGTDGRLHEIDIEFCLGDCCVGHFIDLDLQSPKTRCYSLDEVKAAVDKYINLIDPSYVLEPEDSG